MIQCTECGAISVGKFCSQCGAPLPGRCSACRAIVEIGHRFCSECGTPIQPGPQPRPGQGSSGVSVGDIGVMRGTIDASTNIHNVTNIGSQTNISGPVHIQLDSQSLKPRASELAGKAYAALEAGNYQVAHKLTVQLTELYPEESVGYYLRALAILRGRRPKILALDEAQAIERLLVSAIKLSTAFHKYVPEKMV